MQHYRENPIATYVALTREVKVSAMNTASEATKMPERFNNSSQEPRKSR